MKGKMMSFIVLFSLFLSMTSYADFQDEPYDEVSAIEELSENYDRVPINHLNFDKQTKKLTGISQEGALVSIDTGESMTVMSDGQFSFTIDERIQTVTVNAVDAEGMHPNSVMYNIEKQEIIGEGEETVAPKVKEKKEKTQEKKVTQESSKKKQGETKDTSKESSESSQKKIKQTTETSKSVETSQQSKEEATLSSKIALKKPNKEITKNTWKIILLVLLAAALVLTIFLIIFYRRKRIRKKKKRRKHQRNKRKKHRNEKRKRRKSRHSSKGKKKRKKRL